MPELYDNLRFDEANALTDALNRLADYEDAEAEGRLIVLPVKVDDTIWYHFSLSDKRILPFIRRAKVKEIFFHKKMTLAIEVELVDAKEKGIIRYFHAQDFGKTVFTSREAAEAALKEAQG